MSSYYKKNPIKLLMPASEPPMPTEAELALLRVLWTAGPSTVREVQECLGPDQGYTTVLKQLQIMLDKRLVRRDESQRAHVYEAAVDEAITQRRLVDDLMERAFGGSARALVMRALSSEEVSAEEIDDIRALLDQMEAERNDD